MPPQAERPGGYYQDDGPHANPPADLDQIPDAVPRDEPLHRYANRPYRALDRSYTPATRIAPFSQRGTASWYGRKFHGKRTASGEVYDMYKMTAAHPTLPIPSYVRVRNLDNDRSVVVRINDRGPFLRGRVIDLSYAAAHRLAYIEQGSARVEVTAIIAGDEIELGSVAPVPPMRRPGGAASAAAAAAVALPEAPEIAPIGALPTAEPLALPHTPDANEPSASSPAAPPAVVPQPAADRPVDDGVRQYVQLGAFASRDNAEEFRSMAAGEIGEPLERLEIVPQGLRFRLHLGPYDTVEEARERAEAVGAVLKLKPFVVAR
ncbi:MAG: septal ring lytic transglycosylase RlpA family protein [Rhodocyclaceae bacterium]|nr:septal ring lytic transglycosylase RlpA family protein [Rhodocyclaceae bacterium]